MKISPVFVTIFGWRGIQFHFILTAVSDGGRYELRWVPTDNHVRSTNRHS